MGKSVYLSNMFFSQSHQTRYELHLRIKSDEKKAFKG